MAAGMNAMDLRRGINMAVERVVELLKERSRRISTSEEIAQVSAGAQARTSARGQCRCLICTSEEITQVSARAQVAPLVLVPVPVSLPGPVPEPQSPLGRMHQSVPGPGPVPKSVPVPVPHSH